MSQVAMIIDMSFSRSRKVDVEKENTIKMSKVRHIYIFCLFVP